MSHFSENFKKFRFKTNFRKNWNFSKILTKIESFRKFDPNLYFPKFSKKSKFFVYSDKNRNFLEIWLISKCIEFFKKSKFFENFHQNRKFSKIWPKSIFFGDLTKINIFRNFRNFWPKSKISIMLTFSKHFDFGQNFEKFRKFRKISILVKFSKNFDFGQNFLKVSILVKIFDFFENFEKFRLGSNFRIISIFSKNLSEIKIFWIFRKNETFAKTWPKSKFFEILTGTEIFQNFLKNPNFSKISL